MMEPEHRTVETVTRKERHMTRTTIQGPVGELSVDDGGAGPTAVLFVHSFAGSANHWAAQLEHLRPDRRAVAFDLRGHGRSTAPDLDGYSIVALSDDIGAVADGLGLDRFVLVGHSMGGSAAIAYAGAHPERVAGLVLVGTPGRSRPEQAQSVLGAMEADYEQTMNGYWDRLLADAKPEVEARIRREMEHLSPDAATRMIAATFEYDPVPDLRAYPGPRLAITTSSSATPNDLQALVPEVDHEQVAGTSHWIQMDAPEAFDPILDAFLERVEGTRPADAMRASPEAVKA
jgi:pimeloyl-ACP methyl ester carboxylesterase